MGWVGTTQPAKVKCNSPFPGLLVCMYVYVGIYVCIYACMYEIRDCQDPVKGSGWVLFPSNMAEQPIQQMVVGHLCFQERPEQ